MISSHMVNVRKKIIIQKVYYRTQIFNTENFIHMEIYYIKM